jgi:predicted RNase H-like HicB family nuclease
MSKSQMYHVLIWQEGNYVVSRVIENDVSSFGKDQQECLKHTQEALDLYLQDQSDYISTDLQVVNPQVFTLTYSSDHVTRL